MEILRIKLKSGVVESLNVRGMLGDPPDGVGAVYVLLDVNGKQSPASFHATEGRSETTNTQSLIGHRKSMNS